MDSYKRSWEGFCERWHIRNEWNGRLRSLEKFLNAPIEFYTLQSQDGEAATLLIRIDNWTIQNDIIDAWHDIEDYQRRIWGKEGKRANFMRDLCWYDLDKKLGLKPRQIANIWDSRYPDEIDLLVIRKVRKRIKKEELKGRVLDDFELLEAVKLGFLKEKHKKDFDEERTYYVTGQDLRGRHNPPFVDVVKKAIKRMEKQIEQMKISYISSPKQIGAIMLHGKDLPELREI